jgi:phosphoribosyl-ATP pyrophosphohydrolase
VIVPSIDIVAGRAVQLVGGEGAPMDVGEPLALLERLSVVGEVAVVDIDAARGEGDNSSLVLEMCRRARVRVGGGVRDARKARLLLDAGARKVIIGTAAGPELLAELPRDRVVVALDARNGEVLTHGWRTSSGLDLLEAVARFSGLCDGLLVTFVEREGRMEGTDLDLARRVVAAAGEAGVTIAGGITGSCEIAELDRIGADAQIGMALYTGRIGLAEAFAAPLVSKTGDGHWPTVVTDTDGACLGLAWSSPESLQVAVDRRVGAYQSRRRGLWVKGQESGATQELVSVAADCDRDTLRFIVRQADPGFCHTGTRSCWGDDLGISRLARRLAAIAAAPDPASNTARLLADPALLLAKLVEEAAELGEARSPGDVAEEAADLVYMALVKAVSAGVRLEDVAAVLDARELRVTRRPMVAKEATT